ncbi:MAG TPA: hypothetical protein VFK10_07365, partial [Burkholderiaceae bacterium]|nr:hypothetical protein [Burkholderiaceae bacterium]
MLANIFAGLLLAVLVALALQASRDAYARRAQDATERIAITLQQAIAADLQQADMALRSVQAVWRHAADQRLPAAQLAQMLADQRELNPELQGLLVTDAQGIVRQGRSADAASDLSGRALFRRARDDAAAGVLVSDPLRGGDDQPWSIMLARRLQHADGSFDGVVACQLAVGRFERMFAGIQLGEEGAITLRTDSLQLVARHTSQGPRSQDVGSTQVSRQLIDALRVDPARGFFVSRTALD